MKVKPLTVCICAKDRATELTLCLDSLRQQTFKDFDIVIVDGSVSPQMQPVMLNQFAYFCGRAVTQLVNEGHNVRYVREEQPGIAKVRNQARRLANTEFILTLDDDEILCPDFIEKLYNVIKDDPKIAGVGGLVPMYGAPWIKRSIEKVKPVFNEIKVTKDGDFLCSNCGAVFAPHPQLPLNCRNCKQQYISGDAMYLYDKEEIVPCHHIQSGFMFRRAVAEEIGGRAEDKSFSAFREETEFSMLMRMAGYKLLMHTGAIAWHNHCPSGGARHQGPQMYSKNVVEDDAKFRAKMKPMLAQRGWNP